MKKSILLILVLGFLLIQNQSTAQNEIPFTASEILDKCIQFHDPEGKWDNYSGALKMNVLFPNGNTYGTEIVEIDVPNEFYKWTRIIPGFKVIKGIKNREIYFSVNGNSNPTPEQKQIFMINDENIRQMKEHHYWHFGRFSYLKDSGVELQKEVKKIVFDEKECYQLTFLGDGDKVKNPYFAGKNIFCVDSKTFALLGWVYPEGYGKFEGTIDINGIKIPAFSPWYSNDSKAYLGVTLFSCANDTYLVPAKYQTKSQPTGSNIGYISTHLLKLENEEALKKLEAPIKEINETLAEMGYPECGYVVYKVNDDYPIDYTHIMEGWWLSKEVYNETHNHPKYKEVFEKYRSLFESVLGNQIYFRVEKMMPVW